MKIRKFTPRRNVSGANRYNFKTAHEMIPFQSVGTNDSYARKTPKSGC